MPRFHFNLSDGLADLDVEGCELPGLDSAREGAVLFLGRLLLDKPKEFWIDGEWLLTVTDDRGLVLFNIEVSTQAAPAPQVGLPANPAAAS
jgi:hypothetical protein